MEQQVLLYTILNFSFGGSSNFGGDWLNAYVIATVTMLVTADISD